MRGPSAFLPAAVAAAMVSPAIAGAQGLEDAEIAARISDALDVTLTISDFVVDPHDTECRDAAAFLQGEFNGRWILDRDDEFKLRRLGTALGELCPRNRTNMEKYALLYLVLSVLRTDAGDGRNLAEELDASLGTYWVIRMNRL